MLLHQYCSSISEQKQKYNAQAINVSPSNGMQHWFLFLISFDKAVNTFVNARDMQDFPTIRKKIQVEDDNNDLSIGKKFDKSSELERKEEYEKASLEHQQSKDKQDIILDNNPKDVDEIIKAMTTKTLTQEEMKLLEIHDRTNHYVPIKEIQVLA